MEQFQSTQSEASPRPRRPRGFAATSASNSGSATGARREREKEKERTKLRERHRRAITSRILSGLRQHGNFPLPARADMNDVLAALAREAGWTVEPDGTTYRTSPPVSQFPATAEPGHQTKSLSASSSGAVVDAKDDKFEIDTPMYPNNGNAFPGTLRVPVYVTISPVFINNFCELINTQLLREELCHLKSMNVDGVTVECYWGIVEAWNPQKYNWSGYRELFAFIKDFSFTVQIVLSFHEHDSIVLPHWISEIGKENPDIFFTDREQTRNTECLSWSIDKERVLRGRNAVEVYFDFMRSFRTEFDDMFTGHVIDSVEIGLGPSGELRYPSGGFPGVGQFQCYDKYSLRSLHNEAKSRGKMSWGRVPDNAGNYESTPDETGFFCEKGDYDTYHGRFFLRWYSQSLITHAERVLTVAALAFHDSKLVVRIPAVYWWYGSGSHAAELTAGYYNVSNRNGYSALLKMVKKFSAAVKVVCEGASVGDARADAGGQNGQVVESAWEERVEVGGVNGVCCYEREDYQRMVGIVKGRNEMDERKFSFFVYRQPLPLCQGATCVADALHLVDSLHGELPHHDILPRGC